MGTTLYIEVEGGRLSYEELGAGPLVVCVPSMGDLRQEYRFLAPILADAGFRVATLDLRGLGKSSVAWKDYSVAGIGSDIGALIEHLGEDSAFIVADSVGAGAAVWLAAERADLVRGLALMGPFVRGKAKTLEKILYSLLFADPWGPPVWGKFYASLYPTRKPADFADYLASLRANLAEMGRMAALRNMMRASKEESERRLARVRARTLVLMGSRDPDFKMPENEARWVAGELRGTFMMVEGAGHYPHAEFPEETAKAVLEFLRESDGAKRG